jgi:hypothetical protein
VGKPARIAVVLACLGAAVGLIVFVAMAFIRSSPPTVTFSSQNGKPVNLTIQTVGTIGFGVHPTWVSYLVKDPQGNWVNTTLWKLPAHTKIDVTIDEYDSGSPLRNQQIGSVYGVSSPMLNGRDYTLIDSNTGNGVAHTFSVPQLGINVPLAGVNSNAKNFCGSAPCSLSEAHNTITFSFTTPGSGMYRWQCFVPCGLGFLFGNGGPMQTIGYMGGFLEVS